MLRAALLATLSLGAAATAADLPKDISPEARAAFVKDWQKAYIKAREERQRIHDDAATLAKFPATKKEGEKQLVAAKASLKALETRPWAIAGGPAEVIDNPKSEVGRVVIIQTDSHKFALAEFRPEGALVETVLGAPKKPMIRRYLIATPGVVPKASGKKPDIELPGMWFWAGNVDIKGRSVPVLYRLELKPEDFPK